MHKTELICGPGKDRWKCVDDVELATLAWVQGWYNMAPSHGY